MGCQTGGDTRLNKDLRDYFAGKTSCGSDGEVKPWELIVWRNLLRATFLINELSVVNYLYRVIGLIVPTPMYGPEAWV